MNFSSFINMIKKLRYKIIATSNFSINWIDVDVKETSLVLYMENGYGKRKYKFIRHGYMKDFDCELKHINDIILWKKYCGELPKLSKITKDIK